MKRFIKYSVLALTIFIGNQSFCQSEEKAVLAPINHLFEGMKMADTSLVKKAFAKNVIMKVVSKNGTKDENIKDFINQIANKIITGINRFYHTHFL